MRTRSVAIVIAALLAFGAVVPVTTASAADAPRAPEPQLRVRVDRGTLIPVADRPGRYELTLGGVDKRDRWLCAGDEAASCKLPTRSAVALLDDGADAQPLPAVLHVPGAPDGRDAATFRLTDPTYDATHETVRFRAARVDGSVPRRFGKASLEVDPNGYAGCNVSIHFRMKGYPGDFKFIRYQDVIADAWIAKINGGELFNAQASDGRVETYYARKFPGEIWCRMGLLWKSEVTGAGFFVWFDNYVFKNSDWGCTPPAGFKCNFSGNTSGQPLRLDVTLVPV